jgi:O-antigen/teichoic acid export membrane protein
MQVSRTPSSRIEVKLIFDLKKRWAWLNTAGLKRDLLRGAGGSIGLKVSYTLLAFFASVLLARVLGPAGYGIYAYTLVLVTLGAIPTGLGLRQLVVRETARNQVNGEWGLIRGLLVRGSQAILLASAGLIVLALLVVWLVRPRLSDAAALTVVMALPLLPLLALTRLQGGALRGMKRVVLGQVPELLLRHGLFLLLLLLVWLAFSPETMGPSVAMGLHVLAVGIAWGVGLFLLWRHLPNTVKRAETQTQPRAWASSALPFMLMGGMQLVNSYTDIVVLGMFWPSDEVGIYRVVTQAAALVIFPFQAITMVAMPHFASLWTQGDYQRLQRLLTWHARSVAVMALPAAGAFVFFGQPILAWVFGEAYGAGAMPLALLAIGQMINAAVGSGGILLNAVGQEWHSTAALASGAGLNLVLALALIPAWGPLGASIATAVSLIGWNMVMVAMVWRRLGFDPTALGRPRRRGSPGSGLSPAG